MRPVHYMDCYQIIYIVYHVTPYTRMPPLVSPVLCLVQASVTTSGALAKYTAVVLSKEALQLPGPVSQDSTKHGSPPILEYAFGGLLVAVVLHVASDGIIVDVVYK